MPRRNGVDLALEKASNDGTVNPEAYKTLAELFDPPLTVPAIYRFRRKGWFPLERAKVVAEKYDLPLSDLVRADIREALLANNS